MMKILQTGFPVIAFLLFFVQIAEVKAGELEFQEKASEIILNSLQAEPKRSFLRKAYKELLFTPVWMREKALSSSAKELFTYIRDDKTLNKNGKLYTDSIILEKMAQDMYAKDENIYAKVSLEFKISQLYKGYTDYAYFGSINWGAFNARISNLMVNDVRTEWVLHRPNVYPAEMLGNAALGVSLKKQLKKAIPTAYHYRELQKSLEKYLDMEANGGWKQVSIATKLKPGKHNEGVYSLRDRLRVTGDYRACTDSDESTHYDVCLQNAVKRFQERTGLKKDAVVGGGTLKELNKSVEDRVATIRLNLDRLKWLNNRESKRHIIINIPDFQLYFEDNKKLIQTMRVVTGSTKHPTPIFSDMVETIVLNPYWNIPKSIVQNEMIPKLMKNSNAMKKKNIEIRSGWGKDAKKVSAKSVDWGKYRYSKSMPYRFAQLPGKKNALGKVKFLFPNKFSVYMHDTPSKSLFNRNKRAFSHGCIRLQKPRELLKTFSAYNTNIDFKKSQKILKGKKNAYLRLQEKVPVDVVYLTSWIDYDGKLQFRHDVYGYDKMQLKSFRKW